MSGSAWEMLLLLFLIVLPCVLPLNAVLGALLLFFLFPVVAGVVLSVALFLLPPPAKVPLVARLLAEQQDETFRRSESTAWHDGNLSRMRPWDKLPQWEKHVICESNASLPSAPSSAAVASWRSRRDALRAAALRPLRH